MGVMSVCPRKRKPTSKLGLMEAMLRRPEGATIAQLIKALDWQPHSVRGAMPGALKEKQGLTITAAKNEHRNIVGSCRPRYSAAAARFSASPWTKVPSAWSSGVAAASSAKSMISPI